MSIYSLSSTIIYLYVRTEEREEILKQLDDIETEVNIMKLPLAIADQFYVLRNHIRFVRGRY